MPEIAIQVRRAEAVRNAMAPAVAFALEVSVAPPSLTIQAVLLNCQIQIAAQRRRYAANEQERLRDLFGEPERWEQTLRPLQWTNLTTSIPKFVGCIGISLAVPCSFDFEVAATKYFHGVNAGTIPVSLLFSGTVFYQNDANVLQACPIPWNTEARFAVPASIWKECVELHHPNTAWLGLRRDVFEKLYRFKMQQGLATFDDAMERMMESTLPPEAQWTAR